MRSLLLASIFVLLSTMPVNAAEYQAINAGYRFLGVPDFLLSPTFAAFEPVTAQGATMAYSHGDRDSHWQAGLALGGMMVPNGYWQARGAEQDSAVFVEYKMGFIGAFWAWTWRFDLWRGLSFAPSVGGGIAAVLGDVYATEVIPGCTNRLDRCGHWRNATRHPVPISYRFMPLFLANGQFAWRFSDTFQVGLELGIFNLPFAGISAEYAL